VPYTPHPQFIAIAHNPSTDECEWSVFGGNDGLQAATFRVNKWCERPGWIGFVRPTDNAVHTVS